MAFGSSMQERAGGTGNGTGTGERKAYETQWIDPLVGAYKMYKNGKRVFRILPDVDNDGNLFVPTEYAFAEYWIPVVFADGSTRNQRVMVDFRNPWGNVVWQRLYNDLPRKVNGANNPNRKMPKQRFAINVLDKTKVLFTPDGQVVYPDLDNRYFFIDPTNQQRREITGTPQPLNRVRIFESSSGQDGGKHVLQQIKDLASETSHPNDDTKILSLHEYDLAVKIQGEGELTRRNIILANNYTPLTAEQLALPRYDLARWTRPWPDQLIHDLLDKKPFDEVMKAYDVELYPRLKAADTVDASDTEADESEFNDDIPF